MSYGSLIRLRSVWLCSRRVSASGSVMRDASIAASYRCLSPYPAWSAWYAALLRINAPSRSASVAGRTSRPPMMACNCTMRPPVSSHDSAMRSATMYTIFHGWAPLGIAMREIIAHFLVVCRDEFCKGFEPLRVVLSGRWIRPDQRRIRRWAWAPARRAENQRDAVIRRETS